jgi:hypothetical protein
VAPGTWRRAATTSLAGAKITGNQAGNLGEKTMKKLITIAILTLGFFYVASSLAIDAPIPQCFLCSKW